MKTDFEQKDAKGTKVRMTYCRNCGRRVSVRTDFGVVTFEHHLLICLHETRARIARRNRRAVQALALLSLLLFLLDIAAKISL